MDDPQELKSLDELFRKTFDELPNQASASGWDLPSPQVWNQVQTKIQSPPTGWTGKSILLLSGLAIVLLLGLYWAMSGSASSMEQSPTPSLEQPATPAPLASTPAPLAPKADDTPPATQPLKKQGRNKTGKAIIPTLNAAEPSNAQQEETEARRKLSGSAPLPGTRPASPNTTIRRQMEEWRGAPWAQPLAPLPSILESEFIRPVPESLKQLGGQ